ncbi:Exosome complex component RRP45 [Anabarilius grahami]|uniref:Exosome complex component RRP45 n=1 Tax=Anabarilius grahami TaxID=495550 RepID=A0A3N0XG44_ANAGA|nr:Exosome complex component RRP45 [Anabarilius grahami]
MRDTPLSNCDRLFLLKAIEEKKRLDGRQTYDYRNIKITFGTDYGCCIVELGKTRVLCQVSCELVPPKDSRPTEGIMFFNLELSPMASPAFEPNRQSELLVLLNRQLERCLRNSKCIDTESLCVVSGEKVWQIRVDIHVLNHDGNLMDAASIAAISALSHFRRPDVAIQGRDVTVGSYLLVDPCEREERVKDGLLVIAMNKHQEICSIQSSGGIMLLKDQVLRCSKIASIKVSEITELINKALENDKKIRKEGGKFGFAESMPKERITTLKRDKAPVEMTDVKETANDIVNRTETTTEVASVPSPVLVATGTAQVGEGIVNSWGLDEDEEDEPLTEDRKTDEVMIISDSEEEEVVILNEEAHFTTLLLRMRVYPDARRLTGTSSAFPTVERARP